MGSIIGRVSGDVSGNLDNAICSSLINTFFDNYLNFNTNVFNNVNWQSQIVDNRVVGYNLFLPTNRRTIKMTTRSIYCLL